MKKLIVLFLLCAIFLTACGTSEDPQANHSPLYIPGTTVEDVITWYNEVCLDAEFSDSGDPRLLQKWGEPICYMIHGQTTEEDLEVLVSFTQWLNTLDGFPGIHEATDEAEVNLNIYFCSQEEMIEHLGENLRDSDAGVTYWYYNDSNLVHTAIICIRTDLKQRLRNSVILEELYNGLGPIQDTALRKDSVIYANYSKPQKLSEEDKLILQLLYSPEMAAGMNAAQCEEVIRSLYY